MGALNGILNVDKPAGSSSAAVVARVKRLIPRGTKIGHAGTLDPFATGVLLLLIGRGTKQAERLMGEAKQYECTVKFGATTETNDLDSPEIPWAGATAVTREEVERALPTFVGAIEQRPPVYSALKIGGRPAYAMARAGETPVLVPRMVRVDGIELLEYAWPIARLRIDCGRGTYIRAIARDLGEALNVGGYLTQLRRTRVGIFRVEEAVELGGITEEIVVGRIRAIEE